MPRISLAEELADRLLDGIIEGRYPARSVLPSETELAESANVSRLTVREAIKTLRAQNVVSIQRGRGTYVNPPDRWTALAPVLRAAQAAGSDNGLEGVPYQLLEARRIIEVNIAELAAARRTDEDIAALEKALREMEHAARADDVEAFVTADIRFHRIVLEAAANPFLAAVFDPLGQLLVKARHQTSAHAPIREHAIEHHRNVLTAIRSRDPAQARMAMHGHLRQTEDDLGEYVFHSRPAGRQG
jgi:GntR family transcriptional regulator, transcriptional repressor for pyruvate dehydrogenase complex